MMHRFRWWVSSLIDTERNLESEGYTVVDGGGPSFILRDSMELPFQDRDQNKSYSY
jgi:hypothetical protein